VRHAAWKPNLPVPREVRLQIYAVSPTFRELQGALEANNGWFVYGCPFYPDTCGDLTGGWFPWALREAVAGNRHHDTATDAAAFYLQLAKEINDACDGGQLSCDPPRESLTDPLHWYHVQQFPSHLSTGVAHTLGFSDVHITTSPCVGIEPPYVAMYASTAHHQVDAPPGVPVAWQTELSSEILTRYQWAVPRLMLIALLGYLASWLALVRYRRFDLLLPSTAILLALGVRFALLAAAELVATTPYAPRYYQPNFALLLLFIAINFYALLHLAWRSLPRRAPRPSAAARAAESP